jgi:fructose-1-phosphate kinase PfkB-like protein
MDANIKNLFEAVFDLNKRGVKASLVETNDEVRVNITVNMKRYQLRMLKMSINEFEVKQTIAFLNDFTKQDDAA